jgi:hypothetical protein
MLLRDRPEQADFFLRIRASRHTVISNGEGRFLLPLRSCERSPADVRNLSSSFRSSELNLSPCARYIRT